MSQLPDSGKPQKKISPGAFDPNMMNLLSVFTNLDSETARRAKLVKIKRVFVKNLGSAREYEKEYCRKEAEKGILMIPRMTDDTFNCVCAFLDKCQDIYEVEALNRFINFDNELPGEWLQVAVRGATLRGKHL